MNSNPFYIPPATSGLSDTLMKGLAYRERREQNEQVQQQREQQQALLGQVTQLIDAGDHAGLRKLAAVNPSISGGITPYLKFHDDQSKARYIGTLSRVHKNPEGAAEYFRQAIEEGEKMGVDMTHSRSDLAMIESGELTPQQISDKAATMMVLIPEGQAAYDKLNSIDKSESPVGKMLNDRQRYVQQFGEDSMQVQAVDRAIAGVRDSEGTKLEQGKGDMSGYAFNPETGEYSINPGLKASIEADKAAAPQVEMLDAGQVSSINDKVTALTKGPVQIYSAWQDLIGLEESSSPVAKLGAVFKIMKAFDPTSSVMKSEQGQVYSAAGPMAGFAGYLNSLVGEGGLTEDAFKDIVETAKVMAQTAVGTAQGELDSYLEVMKDNMTPKQFKNLQARLPKFEDSGEMPLGPDGDVPETNAKGWVLEYDDDGGRAYVSPDRTEYEEV